MSFFIINVKRKKGKSRTSRCCSICWSAPLVAATQFFFSRINFERSKRKLFTKLVVFLNFHSVKVLALEEKKIRLLAYMYIFFGVQFTLRFKVLLTRFCCYTRLRNLFILIVISFNNNKINNNNNRIIILILSGQIVTSFSSTAIGSEIQNILLTS